jgi:hypothetical protein
MKSLRLPLLLVSAAVLAPACSATKDNSIVVTSARAPGDKCDFGDPTLYVESGAIDIAAFGNASSYVQVFSWENDLQQISTTVNGDTISGPTLNTFIATQVNLSYVLVGAATSPPPGINNMNATITAGATPDKNSVGVEFLTQQAATFLNAAIPVPAPGGITPSQTLLVTFQIVGALVGGSAAATNPVTYPLTVFKATPPDPGTLTCPGTTNPHFFSTCGIAGRDGPYCY